jgi:hypothetical protein
MSSPGRHNHSPAWAQMTLGDRSSQLRGEVGRSGIGASCAAAGATQGTSGSTDRGTGATAGSEADASYPKPQERWLS